MKYFGRFVTWTEWSRATTELQLLVHSIASRCHYARCSSNMEDRQSITRSEMKCDMIYIIVECDHVYNNVGGCLKAKYCFRNRTAIWTVINHLWYANEGRCYHRTWRVITTHVKGTITTAQIRDYKDLQQITMAHVFCINKRLLMTYKSLIHNYNRQ